jgi:hypothetical protein
MAIGCSALREDRKARQWCVESPQAGALCLTDSGEGMHRERAPKVVAISHAISHGPWSIGEKSIGATGFEPAT